MGLWLQTVTSLLSIAWFVASPFTLKTQNSNQVRMAHYAPGVMERVARRRGMELVDCMMTSPWHPLNTWIRIESKVNGEVAMCRTTDLSAPRDKRRHQKQRLIEVDWKTARRLCAIRRVNQKPPRSCPVSMSVVTADR